MSVLTVNSTDVQDGYVVDTGSGGTATNSSNLLLGSTTGKGGAQVDQSFVGFDTSALGATSTVTAASLTLTGLSASNGLDVTAGYVRAFYYDFGAAVDAADERTAAQLNALTIFGDFPAMTGAGLNGGASYSVTGGNLGAIALAGTTRLVIADKYQWTVNTADSIGEHLTFKDATNSTGKPQLSVTYTPAVAYTSTFTEAEGGADSRTQVEAAVQTVGTEAEGAADAQTQAEAAAQAPTDTATVGDGETGFLTVAGKNQAATTPDSVALSIPGSYELRADMAMAWITAPAASQRVIDKSNLDYGLVVSPAGGASGPTLFAYATDSGGVARSIGSTGRVTGLVDWQRIHLRIVVTVNGASSSASFYYRTANPDTTLLSDDTGWTLLETKAGTLAAASSIRDSSTALAIAATGGAAPFMRVYRAIVTNSATPATVASPDFTAPAAGASSFTDAQGNVWSVNSPAAIVKPGGVVASQGWAQLPTDPEGAADTSSAAQGWGAVPTDPEGAADTATAAQGWVTAQSDPEGGGDGLSQVSAASRQPTEPEGAADATSQVSTAAQSPVDPEGVADPVVQAAVAGQTVQDPEGETDVVVPALGWSSTTVDPEGAVDVAAEQTTGAQSPVDPEGGADSTSTAQGWVAGQVDPESAADVTVQASAAAPALPEAEGAVDAIASSTAGDRRVDEVAGTVDAAAQSSGAAQQPSDQEGAVDAAEQVSSAARQIDDVEPAVDQLVQSAAALASPVDVEGAVDDVNAERGLNAVEVDVEGSVDDVTSGSAVDRRVDDAEPVADVLDQAAVQGADVADVELAADVAVQQEQAVASPVEPVDLVDDATAADAAQRQADDDAGLVDAATGAAAATASFDEQLTAVDFAGQVAAALATVDESLLGSDAATATAALLRAATDGAEIVDDLSAAQGWAVTLLEAPLVLVDDLSVAVGWAAVFDDGIGGRDTLLFTFTVGSLQKIPVMAVVVLSKPSAWVRLGPKPSATVVLGAAPSAWVTLPHRP